MQRPSSEHSAHSRRKLSECGLVWGLVLGGELAVLQAAMLDGLSLDPFTLCDNGRGPAEASVGERHVVEALVVTLVVVVLDEGLDLGLEVTGQEVVFQQDAVLQGLVSALDLALGVDRRPSGTPLMTVKGIAKYRKSRLIGAERDHRYCATPLLLIISNSCMI